VLNAIICLARKEHVLSGDNPVSLVELPPMVRKKSYDLTIHQAKSLLHLMRYPEREITLVAITTGMSVGEICALRWKHVNLSQYAVHCHGRLIPPTSVMIAKEQDIEKTEPKRGRTAKSITLPEPLLHALTTLKKPRNNFDPNGFVFQSRNGKALSPNKLRVLRLKPIGETLGMPWITWRIIRRAHESSLAELRTRLAGELVMTTKHRSHGIGGPVRGV